MRSLLPQWRSSKRSRWFTRDLERIGKALSGFPAAVEDTIQLALEAADIGIYVLIACGIFIVLSLVNYGIGIAIAKGGHVGYEMADGLEKVVNGILRVVRAVAHAFHAHRPGYVTFADQISEFKSSSVHTICADVDSNWRMITVLPRMHLSHHLCPPARMLYGTSVGSLIWPFISWGSFDPHPEHNNCRRPRALEICMVIEWWRVWYVLAILVVVVFVIPIGMPMLVQLLRLGWALLVFAIDLTFRGLIHYTIAVERLLCCHWRFKKAKF